LGSQTIFAIFLPTIFSVALAIMLVVLQFNLPRVWLHNLAIVLGVAGIGAGFGLSLPVGAVLVILFLISVYDYVAVYVTSQMVTMFRELVGRGVIMALIFPMKLRDWAADLRKVSPGNEFMFLGTGDLVMPLVLAVSAVSYGLESAVFTVVGSFVGIVVLHVLFTTQSRKTAMPAMPPLAFFSVLGFLISLFIK
jgi:presenilin-like A22 family membrane protease